MRIFWKIILKLFKFDRSLGDHFLYFSSAYLKTQNMIQFCAEDSRDFWKVYYSNERPYFLAFFPYNKNYTPYLLEVTSSVLCEVKK